MPGKSWLKKKNRKQILRLTDEVSAILRKIVIILLILLACSQLALQNDMVRSLVTGVDKWEGTRLN